MRYTYILVILLLSCPQQIANAQTPVNINSSLEQHIFVGHETQFLPDKGNVLTINDVHKPAFDSLFKHAKRYYPENKPNQYYWYRITMHLTEPLRERSAIIEFFDQTTGEIQAFLPTASGGYALSRSGANLHFMDRLFQHKNFEFELPALPKGDYTCYFKVRSSEGINVIIVYRTVSFFVRYATTEYLTYGLFYGIILIFSLHNLLMFVAIKRRQYLYYVLYILSVGLFEMSSDGIAFQYLWPHSPDWNRYAYGVALFFVSFFALVFTSELLLVKKNAPLLYKLINCVLIVRSVFFVYCLLFNRHMFYYKFVEVVPLFLAFYTGVFVWLKGFKPARFFVLGYTFLTIGFLIRAIAALGYAKIIPGILTTYSLGMSFALEMLFLSFSIGDQVRILRRDKEKTQEAMITQMNINFQLKESHNRELEVKVSERTREVIDKSAEILTQSQLIEEQNRELMLVNDQLKDQAAEIERMNLLLQKDNQVLKTSIEKVNDERVLSTTLSFEEFSQQYDDPDKCYKFLDTVKWGNGFTCIKCGYDSFSMGRSAHSRRCKKCGYEESVIYNTIFQNCRIPINKAFYIVYMVYSTKGNVSSYQLSDALNIRQATCWQYALRIKNIMKGQKRNKKDLQKGWSMLILNKITDFLDTDQS